MEFSPSSGKVRLTANYCHDRLCVPCGAARSGQVARALIKEAAGKSVLFLTLTLRHSPTPLNAQIDRLYASFAALRRRPWWRQQVKGGAAVLEVKVGVDGLWHVHLHCLVLADFIQHKLLCDEWHSITGDSYICDIRRIKNEEAIRYVAAYTGKPLDASIYKSTDRLDEFISAIKGRRVINTFGAWSKVDTKAPDPAAPTDWVAIGKLERLLRDAAGGDAWALKLLETLRLGERDP